MCILYMYHHHTSKNNYSIQYAYREGTYIHIFIYCSDYSIRIAYIIYIIYIIFIIIYMHTCTVSCIILYIFIIYIFIYNILYYI
jgi:hypothetical protein